MDWQTGIVLHRQDPQCVRGKCTESALDGVIVIISDIIYLELDGGSAGLRPDGC